MTHFLRADNWNAELALALGDGWDTFQAILNAIEARGGRALVVGGWVRDMVRHAPAVDVDVEVYGVEPRDLLAILGQHGEVGTVGKAFGIVTVRGLNVDFSIPRHENRRGLGADGFEFLSDPDLSPEDAARRRDLTINSMAFNPRTGEVIDPFRGMEDIAAARLAATDPIHFVEDPLRVYRVAQFAARFEYTPAAELIRICEGLHPGDIPAERILAECDKMLLKGRRPSLGLKFLRDCGWVRYHPELEALIGCPQENDWHPEGDVWTHTLLTTDAAVSQKAEQGETDRVLMYAALCHDLGKPSTTSFSDGRLRSLGHCEAGEAPTRSFLGRLTRESAFVDAAAKLVVNHLMPNSLYTSGAGAAAIRRLAKRLEPEVNIDMLVRLARADHCGRGERHGGEGDYPAAAWLLRMAATLAVTESAERPVLLGRHLLAAGLKPGPEFGSLLKQAYDLQIEEGIREPGILLGRILPMARNSSDAHDS